MREDPRKPTVATGIRICVGSSAIPDAAPTDPRDALVRAAALACDAPLALLVGVDDGCQWSAAHPGLAAAAQPLRQSAFSAAASLCDDLLDVADAALDARFARDPLVSGPPFLRFYAGAPILRDGLRRGTLAVVDTVPRRLTAAQRDTLRCLAVAAGQALDAPGAGDSRPSGAGRDADPGASESEEADFIRTAWFTRAIANATTDLIAFWDRDLRCRFANRAYEDWFGCGSTQVLGRHMRDVIGPSLFALNTPFIERVLGGETQDFERTITRPDGATFHTLAKYVPHVDEGGHVDGFYVTVFDVTSLKSTSLRLGEAEARFRALSEGSPHGVFHCDAAGRCSYVNDRFAEIFALPSRAGEAPLWSDLVSVADRLGLSGLWETAGYEAREIDVEFDIRRSDGIGRRVRLRARPLLEVGRPSPSFVGTVEDVTEQDAALKRLAESEARYRLLSDASSDMVQHLDLAGRRIYVSPASVEIYGHPQADLLGSHAVDLSHPDDTARLAALIDDLASGRQDRARNIHRIRHAGGRWIWVEAQFRVVRDPETGACREIVSSVRDITERETLSRQLEEANQNLKLAEAVARVGHWKLDVEANTLLWSDEVFVMHGVDRGSFVPTAASAIAAYHPDDRAEVERRVTVALRDQEAFQFTLRIIRPGGEIRHVASRGLCAKDDSTGRPLSVFGVVMDVTDLVAAERAVREKSALLENTLDNMDQALIKVSADGTIDLANRRFSELLDLPAELLAGSRPNFEDVLAYLHGIGEYARTDTAFQRNVTARGTPLTLGTYERSRPDGTVLEIRTVPTADGAVIRTYADITARRRAEAAMRESEARYRVLAETTNDVISRFNLALERDYVSGACRRVLGYEPEALVGRGPSDAVHPEDAPGILGLATRLAAGAIAGDRAVATYRMRHTEGHWVWVETGLTLVRDDVTGAPVCITSVLRDVTERQRTALHLEQARAAAEQAAVAKAEFLANMSHELRTPLAGMLGIHDLLGQQGALDAEQRRLLALASDAGRSLLAIVNDILDFSKIEAGRLRLERGPIAIRPLVESCRTLVAEAASGKPVAFACAVAPEVPAWVTGDATRLRQVLLNLLTNAGKFTDRGSVTLTVGVDRAASVLRFDVVDTGIGIAPDKLPTVFDRFSQADASTTRRYGGSGLGLAISKRLVEMMGGRIGIVSEVGRGSTFWFETPMEIHDGADRGRAVPAQVSVPGRRVLLAEDNALNREIVTAMLSHRGFVVTPVVDGADAVDAVRRGGPYDAILMDLQMPVMDGLAATAAIRALERGPARVPILGLTANAMAEDVEACLASGMDAHVAKPIDWAELFGTLERVMTAASRPGAEVFTPPPVFDVARLEALDTILGRSRLAEMLGRFAEDLRQRLPHLASADAAALADEAHTMSGLAGQLGFDALFQLCRGVFEDIRRDGGSDRVGALRDAMQSAAEAATTCRFAEEASAKTRDTSFA